MKKNHRKVVKFLKGKGVNVGILEAEVVKPEVTVQQKELAQLKEGFIALRVLYPAAMHAFCVHFSFVSGVLLENITEKKDIDFFFDTLLKYAKFYSVSIEKDETLPVGWCVNLETSPIETSTGKQCVGLVDATMTQAVLATLKSVFQQMESGLLHAS
jgi:hypothetical protein